MSGLSSTPEEEILRMLEDLRENVSSSVSIENDLDARLELIQAKLRLLSEDPQNKAHLSMSHGDIRRIPTYARQTLFAVKAPSETRFDMTESVGVPASGEEFGETRRLKLHLKSKMPIDVYLIKSLGSTGMTDEVFGSVSLDAGGRHMHQYDPYVDPHLQPSHHHHLPFGEPDYNMMFMDDAVHYNSARHVQDPFWPPHTGHRAAQCTLEEEIYGNRSSADHMDELSQHANLAILHSEPASSAMYFDLPDAGETFDDPFAPTSERHYRK